MHSPAVRACCLAVMGPSLTAPQLISVACTELRICAVFLRWRELHAVIYATKTHRSAPMTRHRHANDSRVGAVSQSGSDSAGLRSGVVAGIVAAAAAVMIGAAAAAGDTVNLNVMTETHCSQKGLVIQRPMLRVTADALKRSKQHLLYNPAVPAQCAPFRGQGATCSAGQRHLITLTSRRASPPLTAGRHRYTLTSTTRQ